MPLRAPLLGLLGALTLAACGGGDGETPDAGPAPDAFVDESGPLFDPAHVMQVDIEMPDADWDLLRVQARSATALFGSCLSQPFDDPFTYFHGAVTIDGTRFADAGVRKKGFLGSLDVDRPSLKIKLDEYVEGQKLLGIKTLTFNNAKQDPSYIRQCLSYRTFTAAGVPASRCNFAHITVSGRDLGLYVHVEGGNKDFLRRAVDDPDGNLYEGTLSDFRDGWTATLELKTNTSANDRRDVDAMVAALAQPDAQLMTALDPILDVDEFLSFWATEVLVTHWDGYDGNTNNFFAYDDPSTGKFELIPWGVDATFQTGANPFGSGSAAVAANSLLARRLYLLPATRDRYIARLRTVLATAWNEADMLAEIDRMEALITPIADPTGSVGLAAQIETVRDVVRGRRAAIEADLANGPPAWTAPLRDPPCFQEIGSLSGSFQTTWGSNTPNSDPFAAGTGTVTGTLNSVALSVTQVGANAGLDNSTNPVKASLGIVAALADGTAELIVFQVDPPAFHTGTLAIDWTSVFGVVYHYTPSTQAFDLVGLFGDGTVHLTMASQTDGAAVTGTFTGSVIRSPF